MTIEKVVITPQEAFKMLEKNSSNRRLRQQTVEVYAEEMKLGKWQLNGETIKFATNGELKDGQHRLSACVLSGIPLETYVIYDNDCSIFDYGAKRTPADILKLKDKDSPIANTLIAAGVRLHLANCAGAKNYDQHQSRGKRNGFIPTISMIVDYAEINKNELIKIEPIINKGSHSKICRKSACFLACYYASLCRVPEEILHKFFEIANTGFPDNKSQFAAIMVRNNLINKRFSAGSLETTKQICMAIKDFQDGKERSAIYNTEDKKIPYMSTVIETEKEAYNL